MVHTAISTLKKHLGISISDIENSLNLGANSLSLVLGHRYQTTVLDQHQHPNVVSLFG